MTQHATKDQAYHDDIAATYDDTVVAPRVVTNDILYAKIARSIKTGDALLDLGCGTGHLSIRLGSKFRRVTAVDHSDGMPAFARKNAAVREGLRVDFVRRDASTFLADCADQEFDTVGCVGFLHHLQPSGIDSLLKQIHRSLKPGGTLILQEPIQVPPNSVPEIITKWNAKSVVVGMQYCHSAPPPDEAPLNLSEFTRWLNDAGFQPHLSLRSWEIFPHTLPSPFLERIYIRYLNWRFGKNGNVFTVVARKRA